MLFCTYQCQCVVVLYLPVVKTNLPVVTLTSSQCVVLQTSSQCVVLCLVSVLFCFVLTIVNKQLTTQRD